MALLGTIRNRFGWVMMGLIFIGIGSFLFMDASGPQNKLNNTSIKVGSINGEKITRQDYNAVSARYKNSGMVDQEIDAKAWNEIVVTRLMIQKAKEAGFEVTAPEMGQLFTSKDRFVMSREVQQQFTNPQTNQIDMGAIQDRLDNYADKATFMANVPEENRTAAEKQFEDWVSLKKRVESQRLQTKYFNALDNGFFTPTWMAESENKLRNTAYSFEYAAIPYSAIQGSKDISDADINAYIKANPRGYKREASVNVDFLTFDVIPTAKDSIDIYTEMADKAKEFMAEENDTFFLEANGEVFESTYFTKDEIKEPKSLHDSLMNAQNGTVVGPYLHNGQYRIAKVVDHKIMPDSVRARHILFQVQTQAQLQRGRQLLDSLKTVLTTDENASFDSLAVLFSQDFLSKDKGGDMGWTGKDGGDEFLKDYLFYSGKKDSLRVIGTQQGFHLIQITAERFDTNEKAVRLAVIGRDIIPSDDTRKAVESKVNDFIIANRDAASMSKAAKEQNIQVGSAAGLQADGYEINGLGKNDAAAKIIEWAHDSKTTVNDVSPEMFRIDNEELNYTSQFVVAAVTKKAPKGLADAGDPIVQAEVDRILRNKAKAEIVNNELKSASSLEAIASKYGVNVQTANAVKYGDAKISAAVTESKVLGAAAVTATGQVSKAVAGNAGVYVVRPTSKAEAPAIADMKQTQADMNNIVTRAVSGSILADMKDEANIVDERKSN